MNKVTLEVDDKKPSRRYEFSKLEVIFVNETFPEKDLIDVAGNILCKGTFERLQVGNTKYFLRVIGGDFRNIPTYTYSMTGAEIEKALQDISEKGETLSKLQIYVSPEIMGGKKCQH